MKVTDADAFDVEICQFFVALGCVIVTTVATPSKQLPMMKILLTFLVAIAPLTSLQTMTLLQEGK